MSRKTKKIIGYILGFILTILLVAFITLAIIKVNVFNVKNIKKDFEKNNYYSLVYTKVLENMQDYMRSSGLDKEILDGLFTEDDIRRDVNKYLDKLYLDSAIEFDENSLKEKLAKNIEDSLAKQNLQVTDKNAIDEFVTEMVKIYKVETNLYNIVDNFTNYVQKGDNVINMALIGLMIVCIVLLITIILMKVHCLGTITFGVGLILAFIRFVIYEKIDFKNILILSKEFSKVLTSILTNIANNLAIFAILFLVVGLIIAIIEAIMRAKRHARYKKVHE